MNKTYLTGADGIRGIAVLIVLVMHAVSVFYPATTPYLAGMGKVGVWLFFVLSAFLLTYKFINKGFGASELASYVIGRTLRILPLFTITVYIYCYAGYYPIEKINDVLFFDIGFYHMWTIPVEFKFYSALPIISFILIYQVKKFGIKAAIGFSIALVLIQQLFFPFFKTPESSIITSWYFPSFLMGIVCAIIYVNSPLSISTKKNDAVVTAIAFAIVLSSPGARHFIFGTEMTKDLQQQFIPLSFLWSVFLLLLVDGKGVWGAVVTSIVMKTLGKWSFSIYLLHWLVYTEISKLYPENVVSMIGAFLIAILIGGFFYGIIEMNMEKLRHNIMRVVKKDMGTQAL